MRLIILFFILAICFTLPQNTLAQTSNAPSNQTTSASRILGDVKEINKEQNWLVIKTAAGEITVNTTKDTVCKRVAPDSKSLEGAEAITFLDILPGDRVWARNTTNLDVNKVEAKQLVLMSATSIAERNKKERENWQRRGILGEITAIDGDNFTLKLRDGNTVTLNFTEKPDIRRYPPGSFEFTASKQIPSSEIKIGDNIFARGERSADNLSFKADFLITGDVPRPTFGQITAINLEKQEITVKTRERETLIQVNPETLLRRMPDDAFTQRQGQEGQGSGQNLQSGQNAPVRQTPAEANATTPPQGQGLGVQRRGGMFNPEAIMERLRNSPVINLNELKVGDFVVSNGPKLDDGKSIKALFVMKVRIPTNPQQGPGLGTGGGGFGDFGPQ
ncbi:MAG: hypothetical protein HY819_11685 [Acidobacteria bacterium]|nr:hypothetical protein [Acidobacteriota bacterium]